MRKLILLIMVATVALVGCEYTTTNTNNNQNIHEGDGGSSVGGPSEVCAPVGSVRISAIPGSLSVGDSERIDATPRDAFNKTRSVECDEASNHQWTVADDDKCTVKDPSQYVTEVVARDQGTCTLTITVDGKSTSASFPIN